MGTVAGLCIGLALAGLATQIMAVQVVGDRNAGRQALARLLARIRHLLQQHGVRKPAVALLQPTVTTRREFNGGDSALATTATLAAVSHFEAANHASHGTAC